MLLGTFISTVNSRLSSFGLADIRGAVHASFDQGAWITTAQSVAQMLIAPAAIWFGGVYGTRRVLMEAAVAFAVVCLIQPYAPNIQTMLGLQFVGGLASGCFIPLTLGFILRNMPPKVWAYGIALYALNLEVSLNISASLEGWYIEHLSWRWIFWQNVPLALGMWYCLKFGTRPEPVNTAHAPAGLVRAAIGRHRLGSHVRRARSGQSPRLAELRAGLGPACAPAVVLLVAFFINERRSANPGVNLQGGLHRAAAAAADPGRIPAPDHPVHGLSDSAVPDHGARLPGARSGAVADLAGGAAAVRSAWSPATACGAWTRGSWPPAGSS